MTITEWLRQRCLAKVITGTIGDKKEPLDWLRRTRWSDLFETYMRNRLILGHFRYGDFGNPNGYDYVASMHTRLNEYTKTGNLEHLVDVANLCMVEFMTSKHPNKHFDAADDGEAGKKLRRES